MIVPGDLLTDIANGPSRSKRLLVTAWILSTGSADDKRALAEARSLWPASRLNDVKEATLVGILLELESMGIIAGVAEDGSHFSVTRRQVGAA
ncbi:MAG TPA: hypothetical protein VK524_34305 [Polyangiaceae bacterium]|nr:hypothetical protein [Polyangiaceae bacterium]